MHKLDWDDLRYVLAVADAGSVNAAARHLGVNHATVLRRILMFEESQGVSLFLRDRKGYRLDPAQAQTLAMIRTIEQSVAEIERGISGSATSVEGVVRLTSTDTLCLAVLPRIIADFHEAYPGIRIALSSTNARLNLSKLDAEVTIRPTKNLPPDLAGTQVGMLGFDVYGTQPYLARNPGRLVTEHLWLGVNELLALSPVGTWQAQCLPEKVIGFRADSFVTLTRVAETGLGLAMIPCCLGDLSENLVVARAVSTRLETPLWVAAHQDLMQSPRIRACVDFFSAALTGMGGYLEGSA